MRLPENRMTEIRIHLPLVHAVIACLKPIIEEDKVADKVVAFFLKQHKSYGARDRSFIAESVYDIVRWRIKYEYQLNGYNPQWNYYKHLLLVSLLNRAYMPVNSEVFDVSAIEMNELLSVIQQPIEEEFIAQSYPRAFYDFALKSIGTEWKKMAVALNQKPAVFIRTNTLKTTRDKLHAALQAEHIECTEVNTLFLQDAIQIHSKNNLKNSTLYKQGWFEFQDIGSQAIGSFVFKNLAEKNKQPIQILDLCAGAGGKTLHLSALLGNNGKIYATDYAAARVEYLKVRAAQAGCKNVEVIPFATAKSLRNIDILLIDAPCSGSGTFKRQADLKYKITEEKVQAYRKIQLDLLRTYIGNITPSGKIIYATCSIFPQENEQQIQEFLEQHKRFVLADECKLSPTNYNGDGFYMACVANSIKIQE